MPPVRTCYAVPPARRDLRVACIGAGPASLACAAELRRHGASVTIVERRALPGGLNTYGVAEYKLRVAESLREAELIRRMGVEFRFGSVIDSTQALEKLESEFDMIFLGVGLGAMQRLGVPGEDHEGVINALALIAAYKTGRLHRIEGTVVVVGAGNTAIDAANAARRLGAETVYILYRRGENDISAFHFEYEHAKQEGVQFLWRRVPLAIRPDAHGRLLLDTVQVQQVGLTHGPGSRFAVHYFLQHGGAGHRPIAVSPRSCSSSARSRSATAASLLIRPPARPATHVTTPAAIA